MELKEGMLVNVYDRKDSLEGVATLVKFDHRFSDGVESWYVIFEGEQIGDMRRRHINPQTASPQIKEVTKLKPGMLVDVYIGDVLQGNAYVIEGLSYDNGSADWVMRFKAHSQIPDNDLEQQSLQDLLARYRDFSSYLEPALRELENLKQAVKDKAMELNENMEIEGAKVELRNGYERTSWDGKKLEGLALVHPEINQCKKMIAVKPTASVTVK